MTKGVAILGSTGSIGTTALRVLARHRSRFHVAALTSNANATLLAEQARATGAPFVGLVSNDANVPDAWCLGPDALVQAAQLPDADIVLNAVVGAAGLDATLAALRAGKRVALANKETLVVAGALATTVAREAGGEIIPVDSEHSAILQCLVGRPRTQVRRIILTASGGPFRDWSRQQLEHATLADALRHPTWQMGRKITVDSATLANKALEVIEAHFLFDLPYEAIDVVVHPQSVVHSMVEFMDGSVLAQVGIPSNNQVRGLTLEERSNAQASLRVLGAGVGTLFLGSELLLELTTIWGSTSGRSIDAVMANYISTFRYG